MTVFEQYRLQTPAVLKIFPKQNAKGEEKW